MTVTAFTHYIDDKVQPRPGAVGAVDATSGKFQFVNPGDAMYSTATMMMTHRWDSPVQGFIPIFTEDE